MSTIILSDETKCAAADALVNWFISQDLTKHDALQVMFLVIAGLYYEGVEDAETIEKKLQMGSRFIRGDIIRFARGEYYLKKIDNDRA